ncbi:MAG: hypothetical protein CFE36_09145 [Sphingomonadaceae bacterium PASS1]|jgi:hypothetical protein|nr:MAG: hypothetical protein CFE36_09145 [Sphingomonadaceae bacterium PASS1]
MADERLIVAIGRIERALSRVEKLVTVPANPHDTDLADRHARLKKETLDAIRGIDQMLSGAN